MVFVFLLQKSRLLCVSAPLRAQFHAKAQRRKEQDDEKKAKYLPLAPIAVKILVSLVFLDETHKIVTNSGTNAS